MRNLISSLKRRIFFKKAARESHFLAIRYPQYDIGANSYGGLTVHEFGEDTKLSIGRYCSFATGVQVMLGGGHRTDWTTTYPFSAIDRRFEHFRGHPVSKGDVKIGNDVWIGREAIILSGVSIGDGAVIAARSVVVKDVNDYEIVGGNPARKIRDRFSQNTTARLLALRWWEWHDNRIAQAMELLLSNDVERFLDSAENGEV